MLKKAYILVLAAIMILSSFAILASETPLYVNSYNTNPENSATGYYYGNVTVYSGGTFNGPLQAVSSNIFLLTENVHGTITDQMNGSTIDGNGLTVNGMINPAVKEENVSGITIENFVIVNMSKAAYGIQLDGVFNSVVDNVTLNNTGEVNVTMLSIYNSGNVTIKNSNFLSGSSITSTDGIDAEYDSSVNISFDNFSGAAKTSLYNSYVYCFSVGQLYASDNTMNSASGAITAFSFQEGGNAIFANDYINNATTGIDFNQGQSITLMNNYINDSTTGIEINQALSYTSYNDTDIFSGQPLYLQYVGSIFIQNGNFSNSTSYSSFGYFNYATVANSTFSSSGIEGIVASYGEAINLYNNQITLDSTNTNAYSVYTEDMSGWVNLVNDRIHAPDSYGLYLDYSPEFNVTNSNFNATFGVYADNNAVIGATISGNTFVDQSMNTAIYLSAISDLYNANIINNTIQSPNSSWGGDGVWVKAQGLSSNITISGNLITNNYYAIYLYESSSGYASDAIIQNNTIINSDYAIYDYFYYNTAITGNRIFNVSVSGIFAGSTSSGIDVSYNLIQNPVGMEMGYGITLEEFEGGNNIVSHNKVLNPGPSSYGIYVYRCDSALVYSNTVSGGEYGIYLYENTPINLFGNTVSNANIGISSEYNTNFSYYGNTVSNSNYSFISSDDYMGSVFGNTFIDTQANASQLYFLSIQYYDAITFYHNNFINSTTNSTTLNIFSYPSGPLFMNAPLPIGGNYWSNYTGTGTNGIGNTPMDVTGTIQDIYPLISKWTSPAVTFIEEGLPSGKSWSASLGGIQKSSTGNSIVFSENNGQYKSVVYEIGSVGGYTLSVSSGTVNENGAGNTVIVTFTPVPAPQYKVTFTESGLPGGTSWAVTMNGTTETSSTGSITFYETNDTYNYSVGSVDGYHTASITGHVAVDGIAQSISVSFQANEYTLTVIETGLPAGDFWNFSLNGSNYTSNSTVLTLIVPTGYYLYNVSGPAGYTISSSTSNFTLNGSNTTLYVHFATQKATPAVSNGGVKVLEGIGIGVVAMAVAGITGSFLILGKFPWELIRKK